MTPERISIEAIELSKSSLIAAATRSHAEYRHPTQAQSEHLLNEGSSAIVPEKSCPLPVDQRSWQLLWEFENNYGPYSHVVQRFFSDLGILDNLETREDFFYALRYIHAVTTLRVAHWLSDEQKLVPVSADERMKLYKGGLFHRHQFHAWEEELETSRRMPQERMTEIRVLVEAAFEQQNSRVE